MRDLMQHLKKGAKNGPKKTEFFESRSRRHDTMTMGATKTMGPRCGA